jgi:hypothetical protein
LVANFNANQGPNNDRRYLRGLLEKTADSDVLREMIGFSAQRLMELEVESLTGARHGLRKGSYFPVMFNQSNSL